MQTYLTPAANNLMSLDFTAEKYYQFFLKIFSEGDVLPLTADDVERAATAEAAVCSRHRRINETAFEDFIVSLKAF